MRPVILRSLVVLLVGAAALAGLLYVASTVDARAPEIVDVRLTQPLPGDDEAALITTSIEVTFNEPVTVDPDTPPLRLKPHVDGTVSWSGSTMIFTPNQRLELETQYTATVTARDIRDESGNRMTAEAPSFTFTTTGPPTVVETTPTDEATDVELDEPLTVTFSTLMDTASVEEALDIEPAMAHRLRWSGEVLEITPLEPLEPGTTYRVRIADDAADVAGVSIERPLAISFRTAPPGLELGTLVPADGTEGVVPTTAIAVIFERAIDPASLSPELLELTPRVGGRLEVVTPDGEVVDAEGDIDGVVLRFTPSGPLDLNTTFEVALGTDLRALDGGTLADGATWSFTTGAPAATLSNQVTVLSDRGGVSNVWAMNPDGSGLHQVTSELRPVVDYAVAPDGSRLVVADGRRLVAYRPDGTDRSVLTDEAHLEFDPAFSPNGQRLAFGRIDAATGEGLGLWMTPPGGSEADPVELPRDLAPGAPTPPSPGTDGGAGLLRAPAFSPDGQALAFVDPAGRVGILELPAERLTLVEAVAASKPMWLPDATAILFTHRPDGSTPGAPAREPPVLPLQPAPGDDHAIGRVSRSGTRLVETGLEDGSRLLAIGRDGRVAVADPDGALVIADDAGQRGRRVAAVEVPVLAAAFAPADDAIMVVIGEERSDPVTGPRAGRVDRLDIGRGELESLVERGAMPRWLP